MAPSRQGSYEIIFGHGHRLSEKDLTDEVAFAALSAELVADEQIRIGDVGNPELATAINALLQKVNTIMTDITALQAAVANVQQVDGAAVTELQTLADRVAGLTAGNVSQADIDGLVSDLASVATTVANATTSAQTETAAPAAAPAPADTSVPAAADQPAGQPSDQAVPAGPVVFDTPLTTTAPDAPAS